VRSNIKRYL
jgi:hypothetical protein